MLWSLPTGLYLLGSRSGDRWNLMTCSWVTQVATVPKLVAVGVEGASVTAGLVAESGRFAVNLLGQADRAVVRRFVKPVTDVEHDPAGRVVALAGEPVEEITGGLPCLSAAIGWLSCEVRRTERFAGLSERPPSHVLFVGEVVDVGMRDRSPGGDDPPGVLRMEDTRMNYGG